MNTRNQGPRRQEIYQSMNEKGTDELLEIWRKGSQEGWTGTAFDVVKEILRQRLGKNFPAGPSSIPGAHSPKAPWPVIMGVVVVLLIGAVAVLNSFSTGHPAPFTSSPASSPPSTAPFTEIPTSTAYPTELPQATPVPNTPLSTIRPLTGVIMPNQNGNGYGELTVDNGTMSDGVVILTLSDKPVMAAYIRSGDSYTMTGINDGTYNLYFSTGTDWNGNAFMTNPSHKKFEDSFEFTTGTTTYTTWRVTLQGVVGGTAAQQDVDAGNFPNIGN